MFLKGQCHELLDFFCVNKLYSTWAFAKIFDFAKIFTENVCLHFQCGHLVRLVADPQQCFPKKMCLQKIFITKIKNCVSDTMQL